MRYADAWRETVERIGRWIDFDNDYKTLNTSFMESVWWVFSQLYKKDQVYRGVRIMPFSTACTTPIANFEAAQNYKDVNDPASKIYFSPLYNLIIFIIYMRIIIYFLVVVSFPLVNEPETLLLAWTTTPWTLPSNLALCTHPEYEYIKIKDELSGRTYVLLEKCLNVLYKDPKKAKYTIEQRFFGKDMKGWEYIPIFDYFVSQV